MTKESEAKRVEFDAPKDWQPPEHKGDEFDLVCTFRVKEDGKLCLIKLGDKEMPGYEHDEKSETEHKPSYGDYAKSITSMMPQGNPGGMGGGY